MANIVKIQDPTQMGEEYLRDLKSKTDSEFSSLLSLLSSYFKSAVDGPVYARSLKAVATELARIRISSEEILNDSNFSKTRDEYINQEIGALIFPDDNYYLGDLTTDVRIFLKRVIEIYLMGSSAEAMRQAAELVLGPGVYVTAHEPPVSAKGPKRFTIRLSTYLSAPGAAPMVGTSLKAMALRILLDIVKPAHVLYDLDFVLSEETSFTKFSGVDGADYAQTIRTNVYQDFRKNFNGIYGIDELGAKTPSNTELAAL